MDSALAVRALLALLLVATPLSGCIGSADDADAVSPAGANATRPDNGTTDGPSQQTGSRDPGDWAPIDEAEIRPGVRVVGDEDVSAVEEQLEDRYACTTNFVFTGPANRSVYLGTAAHCFGDLSDPCTTEEYPGVEPGASVDIQGAEHPGRLVYSSFHTMVQEGQNTSAAACASNDFALVEVNASDRAHVNPAVHRWGGPTGQSDEASVGERVLTYGRSPYRYQADQADDREGAVYDQTEWRVLFYPASSLPGDSGSSLLTEEGEALGVVDSIGLYCAPQIMEDCTKPSSGANRATLLEPAVDYMEAHTDLDVSLAEAQPLQDPLGT